MGWQTGLVDDLAARLPPDARLIVTGSTATPWLLDAWSDLDIRIELGIDTAAVDLFAGLDVWSATESRGLDDHVVRVVLADGRRVDVTTRGGRVLLPPQAADNEIRALAALAAAKLGRGDHLIAMHLVLEVARHCLVQAMLLRDRDLGTNIHRFGSAKDTLAGDVAAVLRRPLSVTPRPNIVEQATQLYGRWRRELDSNYEPDWSGLAATLDRGTKEIC